MANEPNDGRWFDGLPAVGAEIACSGERHKIAWRRGKLVLEDHDLLAERSLTALGADPPECLEVLDAWQLICGTDQLVEFLFYDRTLPTAQMQLRRMRLEFEQRLSAPLLEREQKLRALSRAEALPPDLFRALGLSAVVSAAHRWHDAGYPDTHRPHVAPALTGIVTPLFEQSVRRWQRKLKPSATFQIDARVLAPGRQPSFDARAGKDGASAVLALPISWFPDVWARGIALVDDCLVLARSEAGSHPTSATVTAVRWARAGRRKSKAVIERARVTRGLNGDWSLRWV